MLSIVKEQPGFLGFESARESIGITVSYWSNLEAIKIWKENSEHKLAQKNGSLLWYQSYKVRICKIEQDYEFKKES